jgi:hypothetical protein
MSQYLLQENKPSRLPLQHICFLEVPLNNFKKGIKSWTASISDILYFFWIFSTTDLSFADNEKKPVDVNLGNIIL